LALNILSVFVLGDHVESVIDVTGDKSDIMSGYKCVLFLGLLGKSFNVSLAKQELCSQ